MKDTFQNQDAAAAILTKAEPVALSAPEENRLIQGESSETSPAKNQSGIDEGKREGMEAIKSLVPIAIAKYREILEQDAAPPATLIRICEDILDRVYGKPNTSIKVSSVSQTVEQSQDLIISLVEAVRASRRITVYQDENLLQNIAGGEEEDGDQP